jgi:hypothetical protein
LLPNRLEGGFESRITGEDEGDDLGLCPPHSADNSEAVTWLADIQVGYEDVKFSVRYQVQRFRHGCRGGDREAKRAKHERKSDPDAFLVVDEQNFGLRLRAHFYL